MYSHLHFKLLNLKFLVETAKVSQNLQIVLSSLQPANTVIFSST